MAKRLFEPGKSGNPSGRPKGAKDKRQYKKEVWEACEQVGVDPFVVLAEIAAGVLKKPEGMPEKINAYLRKEAAAELCQYLKPKLKSVELKNDPTEPVQFIMNFGNGNTIPCNTNSQ